MFQFVSLFTWYLPMTICQFSKTLSYCNKLYWSSLMLAVTFIFPKILENLANIDRCLAKTVADLFCHFHGTFCRKKGNKYGSCPPWGKSSRNIFEYFFEIFWKIKSYLISKLLVLLLNSLSSLVLKKMNVSHNIALAYFMVSCVK